MEQESCPVCKSDRYLNPKMLMMVSPCYHKVCDGCVARLFSTGSAPCPVCGASLRRTHWVLPTFEDMAVEKECRIRKRLSTIFCMLPADFEDSRAYNDYLEQVEDIVFNLVNDVDVQQMEAKLEAYKAANQEKIRQNLQSAMSETEQVKAELAEQAARKRWTQEQTLRDLREGARSKQQQELSFIQTLASSNESATAIQTKMSQQKRTVRSVGAPRVVSIEDQLPSMRGLRAKRTADRSAEQAPVDPLETVPLLELPVARPLFADAALWGSGNLFAKEATTSAGYTKAHLMQACWESAFSFGLLLV